MEQSAANPSEDTTQIIGRLDYQGDDATQDTLAAALIRLPEGVRTFALDRCSFVAVADTTDNGFANRSDRYHVVLRVGTDEAGVKRAVAEAWLNQDTEHTTEDNRPDVDELVAQWEFTGPGADA